MKLWCVLALVTSVATGCASSGALGPNGYKQTKVNYEVTYSDPSSKRFLPAEWALDNYAYDAAKKDWSEKKGDEYRAVRFLDEDGDGSVTAGERRKENIYDLRFVNTRDNGVIWIKVHPLTPVTANRDLDVVFDNYVNGLEGTGLFEQSTLFGVEHDKARHFTTFVVDKKATWLGSVASVRGTIEIADVEKLRLQAAHRDSKSTLVFAHVIYYEPTFGTPKSPQWPIVTDPTTKKTSLKRVGLLVAGYYADAKRFDTHVADFEAFLKRVVVPPSAVPDNNALPVITPIVADAPAPVPVPVPTEQRAPAPAPAPAAPPPAALPPAAPPPAAPPPAAPAPIATAAPIKPVAALAPSKTAPGLAPASAPAAVPAAKK